MTCPSQLPQQREAGVGVGAGQAGAGQPGAAVLDGARDADGRRAGAALARAAAQRHTALLPGRGGRAAHGRLVSIQGS